MRRPHQLKIAAYKISSPTNCPIDWTLDCLQNIFKPEHLSLDNDNYTIYLDQIKSYKPDLIISDLEFFTSHAANVLNIPLWQCSSSIINFALTKQYKYDLGYFTKYAYLSYRNPTQVQWLLNIIDNSDRKFVYSHLGDSSQSPELKPGYEWIRPYYQIGKSSPPCQHQVVAGTLKSNKKIINLLRQYSDSVYFMESPCESYPNPQIKDLNNQEEYFCNMTNSPTFVCEGQTSFLADAFYSGKRATVWPDFEDAECVLNSLISEKLGHSTTIYSSDEPISCSFITPNYRNDISFLHQKIEVL